MLTNQPTVTKEQFEKDYAERSGVTVRWLHKNGRRAIREQCDSPDCQGWAMAHVEKWWDDDGKEWT